MQMPTYELEFVREGPLYRREPLVHMIKDLRANGATDLFLFAHGWNNDKADARDLFRRFFDCVEHMAAGAGAPMKQRKFAAVLLLWPSKRFTEKELIPGGGNAAGFEDDEADATLAAALRHQLERLKDDPKRLPERDPGAPAQPEPESPEQLKNLEKAQALIPRLEDDTRAREEFVELLRSTLDPSHGHLDDATEDLFKRAPHEIIEALAQPQEYMPPLMTGGHATSMGDDDDAAAAARGEAQGIKDLWEGAKAAAMRLANFVTYYKMKARAGDVGMKGVAPVIAELRQAIPDLKLHLIGHSFGGRLVTAAAYGLSGDLKVDSMSLLQAAYSHNGLGQKYDEEHDGFFRPVIDRARVRGPIVITHTKNDKAVGVAYPLASRLARQKASALVGDADDPYGGIGRNGALFAKTEVSPAHKTLVSAPNPPPTYEPGKPYTFEPGRIYNLNADVGIDDHNDICTKPVACAVLAAVAVT